MSLSEWKFIRALGPDDILCHILKEFYLIFIDQFQICAYTFIGAGIYPEYLKYRKFVSLLKKITGFNQ